MSFPAYMFDTVIFNRILDGALDIGVFASKARFYATHIQLDEINATSNPQRRTALLEAFNRVTDRKVPTESFEGSRLGEASRDGGNIIPTESSVWDVSVWDQAKWGEDVGLYSAFKAELDILNNSKPNNVQDTLIAEASIKNQFALVTDDVDLCAVTKEFGGKCTNTKQLVSESSPQITR